MMPLSEVPCVRGRITEQGKHMSARDPVRPKYELCLAE